MPVGREIVLISDLPDETGAMPEPGVVEILLKPNGREGELIQCGHRFTRIPSTVVDRREVGLLLGPRLHLEAVRWALRACLVPDADHGADPPAERGGRLLDADALLDGPQDGRLGGVPGTAVG